jgi:hypothetical protein
MAQAEAAEKAERAREHAYGHLVAEAHRAGVSVERPWEQEEEMYARLKAEMAARESVRALSAPSAARPPRPPRAGGGERERPPWEQEEEVYARLAAELAVLESRGHAPLQPPAQKWIPKASLKHSESEAALLKQPPWEQTSEVFQRLIDEMAKLERRADARVEAENRCAPPRGRVRGGATVGPLTLARTGAMGARQRTSRL